MYKNINMNANLFKNIVRLAQIANNIQDEAPEAAQTIDESLSQMQDEQYPKIETPEFTPEDAQDITKLKPEVDKIISELDEDPAFIQAVERASNGDPSAMKDIENMVEQVISKNY